MNVLVEMCEVLRQDLLETERQCQALYDQINKYQANISSFPPAMVKLTFKLMQLQVEARADSLSKAHEEKGFVFVIMLENGLGFYWGDEEYSEAARERFKARGSQLFSPKELGQIIDGLADGLESGQWGEAVKFINRYRIFVESEFSRIC